MKAFINDEPVPSAQAEQLIEMMQKVDQAKRQAQRLVNLSFVMAGAALALGIVSVAWTVFTTVCR